MGLALASNNRERSIDHNFCCPCYEVMLGHLNTRRFGMDGEIVGREANEIKEAYRQRIREDRKLSGLKACEV